uniref:Uncharacterized protein n=1 Tax=Arundo donax TaxID=35708 RepID=A0A0A9ADR8_ARUDO
MLLLLFISKPSGFCALASIILVTDFRDIQLGRCFCTAISMDRQLGKNICLTSTIVLLFQVLLYYSTNECISHVNRFYFTIYPTK